MENLLQTNAEIGGWIIRKQKEPLPDPNESPLIQEMRLMHIDFIEESYWKRCAAKQFAVDCSIVALNKAKMKVTKQTKN